jgi:hypothetical protein
MEAMNDCTVGSPAISAEAYGTRRTILCDREIYDTYQTSGAP